LEEMERQKLVETETQPTQEWQDARRAVEPIIYLKDEAWPLNPDQGFWINYSKRVVQYLMLLSGEVKAGVMAAARMAQPRGLVALLQQWLEYHEWAQVIFVIPPEILSVGIILNQLPEDEECSMVKFKWKQIENMLCQYEGRVSAILAPDFKYESMRKRKIIVISDEHAGTYDPDPKTGEDMYTSMADRMKKTGNYGDIVDFGERCLDFDVIAMKISKFRAEIENDYAATKVPTYVGTVHMFWSMMDSNGEPLVPSNECQAAWDRLVGEFQRMELRVYVTMNHGASTLVDDPEGARKFKQWAGLLTQTMEKVAIVDKGLRFGPTDPRLHQID